MTEATVVQTRAVTIMLARIQARLDFLAELAMFTLATVAAIVPYYLWPDLVGCLGVFSRLAAGPLVFVGVLVVAGTSYIGRTQRADSLKI